MQLEELKQLIDKHILDKEYYSGIANDSIFIVNDQGMSWYKPNVKTIHVIPTDLGYLLTTYIKQETPSLLTLPSHVKQTLKTDGVSLMVLIGNDDEIEAKLAETLDIYFQNM